MRERIRYLASALVIVLWATVGGPVLGRTVTDSAGRHVEVPDNVTRVHAAGPPAAVLLYVLAPEKMIGWLRALREAQKPFLLPSARALPAIGRLTRQADLDRLTVAKPDLIVDFGEVNDNYRGLADLVQKDTGIPYLLIDGRFENIPGALRLLGEVLGVKDRGEELARAAEAIYAKVDGTLAQIPRAQRPRIYSAVGQNGLQTSAEGSFTDEIIARVGGVNVANERRQKGGNLTPEQVVAWSPDAILTLNRAFRDSVAKQAEWQAVPAVAAGRVYLAPLMPFGFIHEPPSVNRLIGLTWLSHLLYRDKAPGDLRQQVRAFYRQFYQVNVNDTDLNRVLESGDN